MFIKHFVAPTQKVDLWVAQGWVAMGVVIPVRLPKKSHPGVNKGYHLESDSETGKNSNHIERTTSGSINITLCLATGSRWDLGVENEADIAQLSLTLKKFKSKSRHPCPPLPVPNVSGDVRGHHRSRWTNNNCTCPMHSKTK